jgi:L-ascorbate metabolism protein UlaG (beta-lactamase superfamily)
MPDRITYVGHATVLIEVGGKRLLTDPALRMRMGGGLGVRHGPEPGEETARDIDAVLISHPHADHLDFASLRRLGKDVPVFAPPGSARLIRRRGFANVTELPPPASARLGELELTATPAVHNGHRWKYGRGHPLAVGFVVAGAGRRVYFAGDTDLFAGMADLAGDLDAALLPIGGWGPSIGRGHLDPQRAAVAASMLKPRLAIPIHWGTFLRFDLHRRKPELLELPARDFVAQMASRAPAVRPVVLSPGESIGLAPP